MVTQTSETISDTKVATTTVERSKAEDTIVLKDREQFELKTPDGTISDEGIGEIADYLYCHQFPPLPNDFEYVWIGKRGTLPKRIQAFYYKEHNIKLSPEHISELGNKAKAHASNGQTYTLDFTNRFDWRAGDFGDGGSCYWGCNSGARDMLTENGAWAVRAFRADGCGRARAWLVPIATNTFVLFNAYGIDALTFSRLLALKWSCSYKKIGLTNNGSDGGTLYINGCNYVIGKHSDISHIEKHDFGWEDVESDSDDTHTVCPRCGEYYDGENDGIWCDSEDREVCSDCGHYCEHCERSFSRGISFNREIDDGVWICRDCEQSHYDALRENESVESEVC